MTASCLSRKKTYLVDARVRSPSISNCNLAIQNLSLWLLKEEGIEVILDGCKVGTWLVRYGGEKDW